MSLFSVYLYLFLHPLLLPRARCFAFGVFYRITRTSFSLIMAPDVISSPTRLESVVDDADEPHAVILEPMEPQVQCAPADIER